MKTKPQRRFHIAGNWKMNCTIAESVALAVAVRDAVHSLQASDKVDVTIFPTSFALDRVISIAQPTTLRFGAQNVYPAKTGAFTGEVSPTLLAAVGAHYALIGHSERRRYFSETEEFLTQKIKSCIEAEILPMYCVGETLEERQNGITEHVLRQQVLTVISALSIDEIARVEIAYEPVWAIGTGLTATPEQAEDAHKYIRDIVQEYFGDDVAQKMRILYGGSMNEKNATELLSQPNVDGGLIGGAALKSEAFVSIINQAYNLS